MAATMATMAMLNAKRLSINSLKNTPSAEPPTKPIFLNLPLGRGLDLLLTVVPAIAWVTSSGFHFPNQRVSAAEIAGVTDGSSGDNRGTLLLFVVTPAILWVVYNILQPALNQLKRMRSD